MNAAGLGFIVAAGLLFAVVFRAARAAFAELERHEHPQPPPWVNDAPVVISVQELVDELNIALWEHELAEDQQ